MRVPLLEPYGSPLCLSGSTNISLFAECLPSIAALFPTYVGARVRRRRKPPHGGAEPLLRGELSTHARLEVKRGSGGHSGELAGVGPTRSQYWSDARESAAFPQVHSAV